MLPTAPGVQTVSGRPLASSDLVCLSPSSVIVISTTSAHYPLPSIPDSELLTFFEPGRVALVGDGAECRLMGYQAS
jgi:hypothetical protein